MAICAFTGAWGVLTGFAIFILLHRTRDVAPRTFWLGLAAAVVASFVVESLRESVRGRTGLGTPVSSRIAQGLGTVLVLAVFELFVLAAHSAADLASHPREVEELRNAILGPVLEDAAGATRDLLVVAGLWVLAGAAVGAVLGALVVRPGRGPGMRRELRAGAIGALAGATAAPLAVVGYILLWRVILALRLAFFDPSALARRLTAFVDPTSLGVYDPPATWYGAALRLAARISAAWVLVPPLGLVVGGALVAAVVVGLRWKRWWPLLVLAALLLPGIAAPLLRDARDLLRLPFMAAVVWIAPAAVLGLAAPLLERPAERSRWWSSIAAALGISVALITLLRLHDARYLLLTLGLFGVAALLAPRGSVEEFWPALALCLAILVTGLSVVVVHLTASFHEVLAGVSRVNALPAEPQGNWRPKVLADDLRTLDESAMPAWAGWYRRQLVDRYAAAGLDERLTILDEVTARIPRDRRETFSRLDAMARNKQRALREAHGDAARRLPLYRSLDGVASAPSEGLWPILSEEYYEARDRAGQPFWEGYARQVDAIRARLEALDTLAGGLAGLRAETMRQSDRDSAQRRWAETGIVQRLEVALAGSTAFWITVGVLAAWQAQRRGSARYPLAERRAS
ncbi:MAG TPA: hypothetical protein VF197_20885 [Methylomirabilota bacterium]